METTTFIPVTKECEAWIIRKLREDFNSFTQPWNIDKAREVITMAYEMGFDDLAREMEGDL